MLGGATIRHSWMLALAMGVLLAGAGRAASASCGEAAGDAAAISAVRASMEERCPCAAATDRGAYTRCAKRVVEEAVTANQLPAYCAATVKRCATKSTCGRDPGAVTCCRTTSSGRTKCRIKSSAAKCRAPASGSVCVGAFRSCCDACGSTGCAPAYTPTPSATPTITPPPPSTPTATPTVTFPAVCESSVGLPALAKVPFTISPGSPQCGGAMLTNPAPAPPFSGAAADGDGNPLGSLGAGCLYAGALPGLTLPDGASALLDVVGFNLLPLSLTLAGSDGNGAFDCTRGSGPGRRCANDATGSDGNGACTTDADCNNAAGACLLAPNCYFGPPIPVFNGALSACVVNAFLSDMCGSVALLPPSATLTTVLSSRVYLTTNPDSPCPRCEAGVSNSGERQGQACAPVGSAATSVDCPPLAQRYLSALTVELTGLSTGATTMAASDGLFCPGQTMPGGFGLGVLRQISETGVPPGGSGDLLSMRLAGTFCVPATGTILDFIGQFPGPGALSAPGTLDLSALF